MGAVHRGALRLAVFAAITAASPLTGFLMAQVAPPAPPAQAPQPAAPQPGTPPEPSAGAQVHTGTSSGLNADVRIQNLLADHQYFRVQDELDQLPPEQAQLYRGILANRNNEPKESIRLLEPLVDKVAASGDTVHEKLLRK